MTKIRSQQRGTPGIPSVSAGRPVLVIEDQRAMSLLLKDMLQKRLGCEVHVANSLSEAQHLLAAGAPYLVALCDLNLPDAAHGEIIEAVTHAGLPAIALTGAFGDELRETILKKGVVDYVLKDSINALSYVCDLVSRFAKNLSIKVLVVDDSLSIRALLKQSLEMYGLKVLVAKDGVEGLALLKAHPDVRVMLADYAMPQMDGFVLTIEARKLYGKDKLAIIGISGNDDPMFTARFLKNGANDFIRKPFHFEEVICRVNQNLEMLELIEISQQAANRDFLTGLANRRYFFHEGAKRYEVSHAKAACAVAMIDIDHFKRVNDTHGHDCGDQVLKAVAHTLAAAFSDQLVARLGGEEFAILLAGVTEAEARQRLESLRQDIADLEIEYHECQVPVTISIGLAIALDDDLETLLRRADDKLYCAKEAGRNRLL